MNSKTWMRIIAPAFLPAPVIPVHLAAQNTAKRHHGQKYDHYQINDMGTFGGPSSHLNLPPLPRAA